MSYEKLTRARIEALPEAEAVGPAQSSSTGRGMSMAG